MEWLREYDKTRRSNWMFVSLDGGKLYLKDELSFAVLYARCRIDGLSVKSEKVTDAAAFDFSKDEKISFRWNTTRRAEATGCLFRLTAESFI